MKFILSIFFLFLSLQLCAQCGNAETNIWNDTWESCQESENPNSDRGLGHWILYEFDAPYQLTKAHIWNTNEIGKSENGFKNVVVDYSEDGINWTELGSFEIPKGTEEAIYGGFTAFDFEKNTARYVLITALSNWGGDCYGLAEVKFNLWSEGIPCEEPPCQEACPAPESLVVADINNTEVTLDWEDVENAEGYLIVIINGEEEEEFEVEDSEIILSDLEEFAFYEIELFTLCEEDTSEDANISFTTGTTGVTNTNGKSLSDVSLFPNPTNANASLVFDSNFSSTAEIQITSLYGIQKYSSIVNFIPGKNNVELSSNKLPAGVYYVTLVVSDEQLSITKKLIVI